LLSQGEHSFGILFFELDKKIKMGWAILESRRTAFPEGTTRIGLKDTPLDEVAEHQTARGGGRTILSPQPSDDPNDPLNWWVHLLVSM
jgi:hypothetical protein